MKNVARFSSIRIRSYRNVGTRNVSTAIATRLRETYFNRPNVDSNNGSNMADYPPRKPNTILHFGKQGYKYVVERFGKFARIEDPGIFITLPIIDRIYEVDARQLVLDVSRQKAYTHDNVAISVAAQLYLTVVDVEKACYKVKQPLVAVVAQAQSVLRTTLGRSNLDDLLSNREFTNGIVFDALKTSMDSWGILVERFEITDLAPDAKIQEAMDLQSKAERERRAMVIIAEGKRTAMELEAEGRGRSMEIEAEGVKTAADTMAAIPDYMLNYNINIAHIKMVGELAGKGHSTYFVPKDISTLPAALAEHIAKK